MMFLLASHRKKEAHEQQSLVDMRSVNDYGRPSLVAQRNAEVKDTE
jgi:hypothetical protein